ncbi:MAG: uracil permease [Bacilli bacterium]|nr:uracil permease [Bacilli bacterium]
MNTEKNLVLDVEEVPSKIHQWFLFSIQHVLAMLVACITVPILTGLPIAATIISAGLGTLCYLFVTKFKSPIFLSSSFTFIAPILAALEVGLISDAGGQNYLAVILGMVMVAVVYLIIGIVIRFVGTSWLDKLLPPVVIGPIIMVIGLSLAKAAVDNLTAASALLNNMDLIAANPAIDAFDHYNLIAILCGFISLTVTALCAHYGKGTILSLIPYVLGMASGYIVAIAFTLIGWNLCHNPYFNIVDFSAFSEIFGDNFSLASIFNYKLFIPNDKESFLFLRFNEIKQFDWARIFEIIVIFVPVTLVSICEHIGDHKNVGNVIGRDLLNDEPGLKNTITGGGLATGISGVLCGGATTTYGENVAVVGTTRIASTRVIAFACIITIFTGLFTPFTAFFKTLPSCVTGGVSLVLYGYISASGINMIIREKVDFGKTRNIFIAAIIWISGIGGLSLTFGSFTLTPLAVAMILGIFFNIILREPKELKENSKIE